MPAHPRIVCVRGAIAPISPRSRVGAVYHALVSLANLLVVFALGSSIALFVTHQRRTLPLIATAVSGAEALLAFGIVRFGIRGVPLMLLLGIALAVAGGVLLARVHGKVQIAAATIITTVGAAQVLTRLGLG